MAAGIAYTALHDQDIRNRLVLRIGYNCGNNPIPKETLTSMVPLTIEHHITGGFGYRFTQR